MAAETDDVAELIRRKRSEIAVCMFEFGTYQAEAERGSFKARNARTQLHQEFDDLCEELAMLQLRAALEGAA